MKEYPETMKLNEVREHLDAGGMAHLAIMDANQPRVRMMSLTTHDNKLWLATWSHCNKVEQIKENPKVEFGYGYRVKKGFGVFQVTGIVHIINKPETREAVSKTIPWVNGYWDSSDYSRWTLIQIEPNTILLDHPDDKKKYTIEL